MFDRNGNVIIKTFNHHLRAIKRTAKERRSDILDNIWFLPEKDDSVVPFYKILNETHQETALYRRQDNKNFCFLSDYRKRLSRAQNFHKKQYIPKISQEKRQLLIERTLLREFIREPDCHKSKGLNCVIKTKVVPNLTPNPHFIYLYQN